MSITITAGPVEVPGELRDYFRRVIDLELDMACDTLAHATFADDNGDKSEAIDRMERLIQAYRAFNADTTAFPADIVELVAGWALKDLTTRLCGDGCDSLDDAERLVRIGRSIERLIEGAE